MKQYGTLLIRFISLSFMLIGVFFALGFNVFAAEVQNDNIFDISVAGFKVKTVLPKEINAQETANAVPKTQQIVPKVNYIVINQKKVIKSDNVNKNTKSDKYLKPVKKHNNEWYYSYSPYKHVDKKRTSYVKKSVQEIRKPAPVVPAEKLDTNTSSAVSSYPIYSGADNQKVNDINKLNENEKGDSFKSPEPNKNETTPSFLKLITSLFFVIVLIVVVGRFAIKLRSVDAASLLSGKLGEKGLNKFKILFTATIGQGKNIHIVDINGKQLVIGSTANNISLLTELKSEDLEKEKEAILSEAAKNTDFEYTDPDNYANAYSELYKEYISDKKD